MSTPESLGELLTISGETARELAGADQSAWNGGVVATSSAMLGLAHWDGTLYLDREAILEPLQHLYEHAGEYHAPPVLLAYKESLATILHEHAHFLGPSGASQDAAREGFLKLGSRELEEGVTEAWAQDHLDEYIHRLGIDKVAPGIDSVSSGGYYPAFVPAVRDLTTDLDARNGYPPGHTLATLNRQTAAGQFPVLVDSLYNSTRLPTLEPPGATTRSTLESLLRTGVSHLATYELTSPNEATTKSHLIAQNLLTHLNQQIHTAESTYTALSGLATPRPTAVTSTPTTPLRPPTRIPELTR
ncbi:hypothetical protein ACFV9C_01385 [Kribbella sp. NPDC059898]|uniref:hypothetical protein n=1 Tax=Kribbella sp. NPDC059898 TaxID=3346995 RepID=UPI003646F34D